MKNAFVAAITLGAIMSYGAEIKEKDGYSGDAAGKSSFVNGDGWAGGNAPCKGNTYVWSSGNLRTPDKKSGTYKFAGDRLTIKGGALTQKVSGGDNALTVIDDLVFKGRSWNQACGVNTLARCDGTFTIDGSSFAIYSAYSSTGGGCHYDFQFLGKFKSASGRTPVITVRQQSYCTNTVGAAAAPYQAEFFARLAGDNSGFAGKWSVQNIEPTAGYPRLESSGAILVAESATALGDEPATFMADAVCLFNHGGLAVAPELCANGPFAPVNRGITIGSTSGDKVGRLTTVSNETWSLGMPIAGDADARLIKGGAGTVRLCGAYEAGPITVESGTLVWASASEMPSITVENGAGLWISATGEKSMTGVTVNGVESVLDPEGKTCGKVVLDETCSLGDGPVGFRFAVAPAEDDYTKYEVLNVPLSVRELVPADFCDETPGTAKRWFSIEVVNGVQKVFVSQYPLVKINAGAVDTSGPHSGWWFMSDADAWENGMTPSPDNDYEINLQVKNSLRTSAGSSGTYVFPGHSLTIGTGRWLADKNANLVISNLVLTKNAYVNASGASGSIKDQWLHGTMFVSSDCTFSAPASIKGVADHQMCLACDISGSGVLTFCPYEADTTQTSTLTGDNHLFTGNLRLAPTSKTDKPDAVQTLIFTKSECLGGARSAFDYQAVRIGKGCRLFPAGTMTIEAENRGIYFENGGFFTVTGGVVTVKDTIRKNMTLTKDGAGILELACPVAFGASGMSNNDQDRLLTVAEGGLGVAASGAFGEFIMTFGKDAFLAVNAEAENDEVRTYGAKSERTDAIAIPDGVLNVHIRASEEFLSSKGAFSVPICTVSAEVADVIDGKIVVANVKRYRTLVRKESVGSLVRFMADMTPSGLCVIIR